MTATGDTLKIRTEMQLVKISSLATFTDDDYVGFRFQVFHRLDNVPMPQSGGHFHWPRCDNHIPGVIQNYPSALLRQAGILCIELGQLFE